MSGRWDICGALLQQYGRKHQLAYSVCTAHTGAALMTTLWIIAVRWTYDPSLLSLFPKCCPLTRINILLPSNVISLNRARDIFSSLLRGKKRGEMDVIEAHWFWDVFTRHWGESWVLARCLIWSGEEVIMDSILSLLPSLWFVTKPGCHWLDVGQLWLLRPDFHCCRWLHICWQHSQGRVKKDTPCIQRVKLIKREMC